MAQFWILYDEKKGKGDPEGFSRSMTGKEGFLEENIEKQQTLKVENPLSELVFGLGVLSAV